MVNAALSLAAILLMPGHGHVTAHAHTRPATASLSMGRKAASPIRSALAVPVAPLTHKVLHVDVPGGTRLRWAGSATGAPTYRQTLRAEAARTASLLGPPSISQSQAAEVKRALAGKNLTAAEAAGLQSDLATIRTHRPGSPEAREAISDITTRLRFAGVSSGTLDAVEGTLKGAHRPPKR